MHSHGRTRRKLPSQGAPLSGSPAAACGRRWRGGFSAVAEFARRRVVALLTAAMSTSRPSKPGILAGRGSFFMGYALILASSSADASPGCSWASPLPPPALAAMVLCSCAPWSREGRRGAKVKKRCFCTAGASQGGLERPFAWRNRRQPRARAQFRAPPHFPRPVQHLAAQCAAQQHSSLHRSSAPCARGCGFRMADTGAAAPDGKKARTADGHMARFPDLDRILSRASPFENSTGKLPMGKFEPGAKVGARWRGGLRRTVPSAVQHGATGVRRRGRTCSGRASVSLARGGWGVRCGRRRGAGRAPTSHAVRRRGADPQGAGAVWLPHHPRD